MALSIQLEVGQRKVLLTGHHTPSDSIETLKGLIIPLLYTASDQKLEMGMRWEQRLTLSCQIYIQLC